jgi:enoyl-CoA hydratase/carnithine racemase
MERGRGALRITLANPKRRNVLGSQMINELLYAIEDAQADEDVRFLTITGEGKVFSAGGDLAQMHSGGDSVRPSADRTILPHKGDYADLLTALLHSEKPIIARVNGHALGSAVGLVAACTFSVALMDAQFGTPEVHSGLFPMVAMALLTRVLPRRRLLEMIVLGEKLDATEAARIGLVGQAVEPGELDETIRTIETQILHKSPTALRLGLRAFAAQQDLELARAFPLLRERFGEILNTEDAQEGLNAFLEKRPPKWKGSA